jgi:three-Cys-motif partner protein
LISLDAEHLHKDSNWSNIRSWRGDKLEAMENIMGGKAEHGDYVGREQSLLKHRVLEEYLKQWAYSLGSALKGRATAERLWFVDCFAGPWNNERNDLADTSVAIGLGALQEAVQGWSEAGHLINVGAVFIGTNKAAASQIEEYVASTAGAISCTVLQGTFEEHVVTIEKIIGNDAAFIFVDPTGWKGADMQFIKRLAQRERRDVLINVMYEHVNRFVDDPRPFLKDQMQRFFGLSEGTIPPDLDERGLIDFYRKRLREVCGLRYAADVAVPFPSKSRTYFRLVIGGNHKKVIELFRDVEDKVISKEAATIRANASQRKHDGVAQLSLLKSTAPSPGTADWRHRELHEGDKFNAVTRALELLEERKAVTFGELWPELLQDFHVTKRTLGEMLIKNTRVKTPEMKKRETVLKDHHLLTLLT